METLKIVVGFFFVYLFLDKYLFNGVLGTLIFQGFQFYFPRKKRSEREVSEPDFEQETVDFILRKRYDAGLPMPESDTEPQGASEEQEVTNFEQQKNLELWKKITSEDNESETVQHWNPVDLEDEDEIDRYEYRKKEVREMISLLTDDQQQMESAMSEQEKKSLENFSSASFK